MDAKQIPMLFAGALCLVALFMLAIRILSIGF